MTECTAHVVIEIYVTWILVASQVSNKKSFQDSESKYNVDLLFIYCFIGFVILIMFFPAAMLVTKFNYVYCHKNLYTSQSDIQNL